MPHPGMSKLDIEPNHVAIQKIQRRLRYHNEKLPIGADPYL